MSHRGSLMPSESNSEGNPNRVDHGLIVFSISLLKFSNTSSSLRMGLFSSFLTILLLLQIPHIQTSSTSMTLREIKGFKQKAGRV
jgi:hypothetical protein